MKAIYYIQFEDRNTTESSTNTLACLRAKFHDAVETIVFSNRTATQKYSKTGVPTTIYYNNRYKLTDINSVLVTLTEIFTGQSDYLIVFDDNDLGNYFAEALAAELFTEVILHIDTITSNPLTLSKRIGNSKLVRVIPMAKSVIITANLGNADEFKTADSQVRIIDWRINERNFETNRFEHGSTAELSRTKIITLEKASPTVLSEITCVSKEINQSCEDYSLPNVVKAVV